MKFSKEEEYLRKKDKKLKKIIDKNGHIAFKPNSKNQFDSLVQITISQFISTKAAKSIHQKIKDKFKTEYLNERDFENLSLKEIKNLGLSMNKAKTIKELSDHYLDGTFIDLTKIKSEELNNKLLSVFGIGPWSVNMFEIFCIGNLDIFTSKDAGLRLAMDNHKMIRNPNNLENYDNYAQRWSPYKTIASIHLWKTVD